MFVHIVHVQTFAFHLIFVLAVSCVHLGFFTRAFVYEKLKQRVLYLQEAVRS